MPQRKAQRRNRLSAAGRHGKGVNAPRLFSCRQASIQYFTAQPIKLRLRILPWLNVFFQSSQQRLQIVRPAAPAIALHEKLGIQKVRIYKAGIQYSRPIGNLQLVLWRKIRHICR